MIKNGEEGREYGRKKYRVGGKIIEWYFECLMDGLELFVIIGTLKKQKKIEIVSFLDVKIKMVIAQE